MKRLALVTLSVVLAAACSRTPEEPATAATPPAAEPAPATAPTPPPATAPASTVDANLLGGHHWLLQQAVDAKGQRIEALFARADKPVQLDFNQGRINVSNTCNRIGGGYRLDGTNLIVSDLASTMMACVDKKLMALDQEVSKRLQGTQAAGLTADGSLTLTSTGGDVLTFRGEPTAETRFGGPGEIAFLEIAPESKPCTHPLVPNRQCLQVREVFFDANGLRTGAQEGWQPLYQDIEGFTHEEGTRNVVRVKRFVAKNPPADAASVAYVLDMVVESEKVAAKR